MRENGSAMESKFWFLAIVPLVVWAGLFFYMLMVDRKLARLEAGREQDDL
jgi:CcmD family protein